LFEEVGLTALDEPRHILTEMLTRLGDKYPVRRNTS
jgi:hypothetical protein